MPIPRIRAMRPNASVEDFTTKRVDASIGLNKFGLFGLTLGALTSRDDTIELTDLARKLDIKEEDKELWEGFQLGICGFTSVNFRTCFDEMKQKLRDAGFPMETIQIMFNHAIIGLPKSEKQLLPVQRRFKTVLSDAAFSAGNDVGFESDTYELVLFESEDEVWNVYRTFSDELQRERVETYSTPQLRAQLKSELDQLVEKVKVKAGKVTLNEPKKEMQPSQPTKDFPVIGKRRCCVEEDVVRDANAAKSAKVQHLHNQVVMRSTDWLDLLGRMASTQQ